MKEVYYCDVVYRPFASNPILMNVISDSSLVLRDNTK